MRARWNELLTAKQLWALKITKIKQLRGLGPSPDSYKKKVYWVTGISAIKYVLLVHMNFSNQTRFTGSHEFQRSHTLYLVTCDHTRLTGSLTRVWGNWITAPSCALLLFLIALLKGLKCRWCVSRLWTYGVGADAVSVQRDRGASIFRQHRHSNPQKLLII